MKEWINEARVRELRAAVDADCRKALAHEQITPTMPFCRHCGDPMPLTEGDER